MTIQLYVEKNMKQTDQLWKMLIIPILDEVRFCFAIFSAFFPSVSILRVSLVVSYFFSVNAN